ncbi:MAG TPA: hypothetical protein VGY55_05545 [Pirellulales bacterium]|jgi:hypothetical protein|nr:hypothetical protein [Pirellulales bacterium]
MATDATSETAIFERIVLPGEPRLSEQAAKSILAISFGADDRDRLKVLAEKARHGTLTPEEQLSIDNYERVGHYLAILQSKARLALQKTRDIDS